MFDRWLKKKTEVVSPVKGVCIPLEQVKDSVFASKMLGDGFAVEPAEDLVSAPVAGKVVMLPATGHAVGIRTDKGVEVLIHIGIDTVELQGEGFECLVSKGDRVRCGDPLIEFDGALMKKKGLYMTIMVIFTEGYSGSPDASCYGKTVAMGEPLMTLD